MTIAQRIKLLFAATTAQKTTDETIKDAQGRLCPLTMFSDVQLARDHLIKQEVTEAKRRAVEQGNYHQDLVASISEFFRISAEEHNAKGLGDEDGVSMVSIDGLQRIKLVKAKSATANEKLMIAKTMLEKLVEVP